MSAARVPASTYRVQVTAETDLHAAAGLLGYLHDLGVDWVYLSPLLEAEPGSDHGYDVVDHGRVDPSRGGAEGLAAVSARARELGMGVLVDIVPNHIGCRHARGERLVVGPAHPRPGVRVRLGLRRRLGGRRTAGCACRSSATTTFRRPARGGSRTSLVAGEGDELRYHDHASRSLPAPPRRATTPTPCTPGSPTSW